MVIQMQDEIMIMLVNMTIMLLATIIMMTMIMVTLSQ